MATRMFIVRLVLLVKIAEAAAISPIIKRNGWAAPLINSTQKRMFDRSKYRPAANTSRPQVMCFGLMAVAFIILFPLMLLYVSCLLLAINMTS